MKISSIILGIILILIGVGIILDSFFGISILEILKKYQILTIIIALLIIALGIKVLIKSAK